MITAAIYLTIGALIFWPTMVPALRAQRQQGAPAWGMHIAIALAVVFWPVVVAYDAMREH